MTYRNYAASHSMPPFSPQKKGAVGNTHGSPQQKSRGHVCPRLLRSFNSDQAHYTYRIPFHYPAYG
jgi:hypothetical protein